MFQRRSCSDGIPGEGDRLHRRQLGQASGGGSQVLVQLFLCFPPGLDQQRRHRRIQIHQVQGQAGLVFHRPQAGAVHDLDCRDGTIPQQGGGFAGGPDVGEEDQGGGLVGMVGDGPVGDFGDKAQGAFGTDHQVLNHLDGIVEIDQGVQAVAGGILHFELAANPSGQFPVLSGPLRQAPNALHQVRTGLAEPIPAGGTAGVQPGAVGKDDSHALQGPIAVLGGAATHSAGVVGGDSTLPWRH